MTKEHETQSVLANAGSANAEAAYDRLTGYAFARRYARGKVVADVGLQEIGYGPSLLAETAASVAGLAGSPEAAELASAAHPAPNVEYRGIDLPALPYPDEHFDVVVALDVVEGPGGPEDPEDLVGEARRVLKRDGVLVVCVPERRARGAGAPAGDNGRRGVHEAWFREMLGRHFGHVRLYRLGAVAGGFVFPISAEKDGETDGGTGALVEFAQPSAAGPGLGGGLPTARSVVAVCGDDAEALGREDGPYLLVDRDRRVFDEREELAEEVGLLRAEIRQMQETEVQAFRDTVELRKGLTNEIGRILFHLRHYRVHLRNVADGVSRRLTGSPSADERER